MTASNQILNYLSLMIFPLLVGCGMPFDVEKA